jgi:hypothetical protein
LEDRTDFVVNLLCVARSSFLQLQSKTEGDEGDSRLTLRRERGKLFGSFVPIGSEDGLEHSTTYNQRSVSLILIDVLGSLAPLLATHELDKLCEERPTAELFAQVVATIRPTFTDIPEGVFGAVEHLLTSLLLPNLFQPESFESLADTASSVLEDLVVDPADLDLVTKLILVPFLGLHCKYLLVFRFKDIFLFIMF